MNHWLERRKTKNHLYMVDDGEKHWYSAESAAEATQMHFSLYGDDYGYDKEEIDIIEVNPNKVIFVMNDDMDRRVVKKTASEWAAEGKGFVASTLY